MSDPVEFTCQYCTPEVDVEGLLMIIPKRYVVIFTPSVDSVEIPPCQIHLNDVFELCTVIVPGETEEVVVFYVQLQFRSTPPTVHDDLVLRNVFFRFNSKDDMIISAKILLELKNDNTQLSYDPSITQIPYFSDHLNFSPIVSPETKPITFWSCPTNPRISPREPENRRPSSPALLLLSPPKLSIHPTDKSAHEYTGPLLAHNELIADVRELLPIEYRFHKWRLVYSPKVHGISLSTFYRNAETTESPSIILITDGKRDCLFGGFCISPWKCRKKFYGHCENFLFSLIKGNIVKTEYFPWAMGNNRLFQYSDNEKLVIGGNVSGGNTSGSAIVIHDNWLRGSSHACETFSTNHSLCCTKDFVVGDVEFWALTDPQAS
jgi:hypothetical protein